MKKNTLIVVVLALLFASFGACTHVESDEIGIRVLNFPYFHGIKKKPMTPGWAVDIPYIHDFYKMNITVHNMEMSEFGDVTYKVPGQTKRTVSQQAEDINAPAELNLDEKLDWVESKLSRIDQRQYIVDHDRRRGDKSVWIKTADGNDAWLDVVVQYKVAPERAYLLVQNMRMKNGTSNVEEDVEALVESMVRSSIRFYLSALNTIDIAVTEKRADQVEKSFEDLNDKFGIFGLELVSLYTPRIRFHRDYEMMIELKQVVEEEKEEFKVQMETAREMIKKNESRAQGIANAMVERANGRLGAAEFKAEAELEAKTKEAEALGFKYVELANGIDAQAKALAASGGQTHVGLAISEALQGKRIIIVPGEGNLNMMDVNDLLQTYGAAKALKSEKKKAGEYEVPALPDVKDVESRDTYKGTKMPSASVEDVKEKVDEMERELYEKHMTQEEK